MGKPAWLFLLVWGFQVALSLRIWGCVKTDRTIQGGMNIPLPPLAGHFCYLGVLSEAAGSDRGRVTATLLYPWEPLQWLYSNRLRKQCNLPKAQVVQLHRKLCHAFFSDLADMLLLKPVPLNVRIVGSGTKQTGNSVHMCATLPTLNCSPSPAGPWKFLPRNHHSPAQLEMLGWLAAKDRRSATSSLVNDG